MPPGWAFLRVRVAGRLAEPCVSDLETDLAPWRGKQEARASAFANAFRTPDLRKKLLFVLVIIVLFRLGLARSRRPGVDVANVQALLRRRPRATAASTA